MKVLVTGGNGFIGYKLAVRLLNDGVPTSDGGSTPVTSLVLTDVQPAPVPLTDARIRTEICDISDPGVATQLIGTDTDVVFHLAAIVSGQAEKEFDFGLKVNMEGTQLLLEACRLAGNNPIVVYASSCAVYGGEMPEVMTDETYPYPQTSYGSQKLLGELLVTDYSRKGFINGFSLRLPTVVVRPGKPNAAASSFASSIIREPLNGQSVICPINQDTPVWLTSPSVVSANIRHAASIAPTALPFTRSIALPGMTVTVLEMLDALESVAGSNTRGLVEQKNDPVIEKIVYSWPGRFSTDRANSLGFKGNDSFNDIVQEYIDEYISK